MEKQMKWYVTPGNLGPFETRHEAVGAKAIHEREYSYYPLGSVHTDGNKKALRIESYEE